MSDDLATLTSLESITRRALTFQRYIFRRSYGVYYAVWALAIAVFQFLPSVIFSYLGLTAAGYLLFGIAAISIGMAATLATFQNFGRAARTVALRDTLHPAGAQKSPSFITFWWVAFIAVLAIGFVLAASTFLSLLNGLPLFLDVFIFTQLRQTFPDGMPFEGKVAVVTFGGSAVGSLVASLANVSPWLAELPWLVTVAAWLFCSLYALKHAPEELVSASY